MDYEKYQQVKRLFLTTLALPPGDRPARLKEICGEDEELLDTVEQLLDQIQTGDGFLEA